MLVNKTVTDFINEVNSPSPAPGGGSVSALVGALGCSLIAMYTHLSVTKKKFKEAPVAIQTEFDNRMQELQSSINNFLKYIDQDTEVYNTVMAAYKLPKDSDEDKTKRNEAIYDAIEQAIASPMVMMEEGVSILQQLNNMLPYGNINATSDFAVGVILLDAAVQGAGLNVKINLSSAREQVSIENEAKMNKLLKQSQILKDHLLTEAYKLL